jgi:hypothetical protein
MKKAIKYQFILTVLSVLFCCYSFAQQNNSDRAGRGAQRMGQQLSLSAGQMKKLDSLLVLYDGKLTAIAQSGSSEPEKGNQRKALFTEKEQAMKQLMTDEQYKRFSKLREEHAVAAKKRKPVIRKATRN